VWSLPATTEKQAGAPSLHQWPGGYEAELSGYLLLVATNLRKNGGRSWNFAFFIQE
jgi:hypothetical protein